MKLEKLTLPLMIAAAIVGLWIFFKPKSAPSVSTQPSAASSGVPQYMPQATQYQVNPPQLSAPTQAQLLSNPWANNPAAPPPTTPPPYLAFNFGPGHDLSKVPLTPDQKAQMSGDRSSCNTCGCGGSCNGAGNSCANDPNHSVYPDGSGSTRLIKSGPSLMLQMKRSDPGWLNRAAYNLTGSDVDPNQLSQAHIHQLAEQPTPNTPGQAVAAQSASLQPASAPGTGPGMFTRPINQTSVIPIAAAKAGGGIFNLGNQDFNNALNGRMIQRLVQNPSGAPNSTFTL